MIDAGRFGILEVDGNDAHPPENAAAEHERDRLFKQHGIRVVERFPATACYEDSDRVVAEFLRGHADPGFTLRTYVHHMDEGLGDADFLDELVTGPVTGVQSVATRDDVGRLR